MIFILNMIFQLLYILILARVILSWIPIDPYSSFYPIKRTVFEITEPILEPIRRILPPMSGIDFSPIILFLLLSVVQRALLAAF